MYIGIDPGTVNLGIAAVGMQFGEVSLRTSVLNLKESKLSRINFVASILDLMHTWQDDTTMEGVFEHIECVTIERYVPYAGTFSTDSEHIVLLIGALEYAFNREYGCSVNIVRAIDWKPKLCKALYKKMKFNNPSTKFDKKFSHAAATCITAQKFKTDHEADAVCLAYYDKI